MLLFVLVVMGGVVRGHGHRGGGDAGLDREHPAPFSRHPTRRHGQAHEQGAGQQEVYWKARAAIHEARSRLGETLWER